MAGYKNNAGMISDINVTPLVDIVLVLLIVLMVTVKVISTPAVPLDLPRAATSEQVDVVFSIVIDAKHQRFVNGSPVPDDALLSRAAVQAKKANADVRAVIHADGSVSHRNVIHALDLLKQAGIDRVAFAALPEAP